MNNRWNNWPVILFLFSLSAIIIFRQFTTAGYFSRSENDTLIYTTWAWQFTEALKEGIIYPRWMHLNFWGYGGPTFLVYPPLVFYLVAFFNLFAPSIVTAMKITKLTALFLSATGMFFLVQEYYPKKIAILTSAYYIVFPYTVSGIYLSGAFVSMISFMWFAPIVLFINRYLNYGQFHYVILAGVFFGGLILTHLINAYMFALVILTFIIYMSINRGTPKDLIAIPLIIAIGLLTSAAYLLPLLYERRFINTDAFIDTNFADFFILPNLTSKLSSDHFWRAGYDDLLFYILFVSIIIFLGYFCIARIRQIKTMQNVNKVNKFFLVTSIFCIFLLFGISSFVWKTVPFFKYFQFPVRWLNINAFAVIFLSAPLFWVLVSVYRNRRGYRFFAVLLILTSLLLSYNLILDYRYIRYAHIFAIEKILDSLEFGYPTKEHLPIGVEIDKINKHGSKEKVVVTEGEGDYKVVKWESAKRIVEITAYQPLILRIRTFNFPGWTAHIDGVKTEIKTEKGMGAMLIDIAPGKHMLILKFVDTPIVYYSKIISLASFSCIIILVIFQKRKTYGHKRELDNKLI
jgi:hypothetical protein